MKKITPAGLIARIKQSRPEHREHAVAVAAIFVLTAILFAPLLSGKTFSMVGAHMYGQYPWAGRIVDTPEIVGRGYPQTDHAETFYPNSVFASNAIRSGQLPLWFPYSFGGIPLAELSLGGLLYPPRLLVIPFLEPISQHDFLLFTHFLLAGLGMYGLLRCWGCNIFGAIFGGMVWEINGYNAFFLTFEHIALAAAWLPLMLLAATLAIRKRSVKWAVGAGAALAMSVLTGSLMHAYLNALLLFGWYAVLLALEARKLQRSSWRDLFKLVSLAICTGIVAAAMGAVCYLPLFQWLPYVHRQSQPLATQLADVIPAGDFARALIRPESASGPAGKAPDAPGLAFTGVVALALAIAGLFRRAAPVFFAIATGAFSLAFSLGVVPLIKLLRPTLPFFDSLHPYTGFYLFCFVVAVLSAFGITEVGRRFAGAKWSNRLLMGLWCMAVLVQAWQLIGFTWAINPVQPKRSEWLFPETPLIETLRGLQGEYRMLPIIFRDAKGQWTHPVLTGKIASIYGLRSGSGYESLLPTFTGGMWSTVELGGSLARDLPLAYKPYFKHDSLPMNLLEKVSVGLLVTAPGIIPRDVSGRDPTRDGTLELVYQGADGWIYKDTRALPRAFLVPQVLAAPDASTALAMLLDEKFDARNAAIVIGEQTAAEVALPTDNLAASFQATASIIRDRLNDVEVESVTPRVAMMVLNDSWAPGWKAFVDGVEQPVLRVNYGFRGVVVPEGRHRVIFLYRPRMFLAGLFISSISLMFVCILYVWIGVHSLRRSLNTKPARARERVSEA